MVDPGGRRGPADATASSGSSPTSSPRPTSSIRLGRLRRPGETSISSRPSTAAFRSALGGAAAAGQTREEHVTVSRTAVTGGDRRSTVRGRGHARRTRTRSGRRPSRTSPGCWPRSRCSRSACVLVVGGAGPPVHDAAAPADRGRPRPRRGRPRPARPRRDGPGRSVGAGRARPSSSTRWPTGSRRASRSSAATATAAATSWPTSRTSCGRRSPRCARSTSCSPRAPATIPTPGPSSSRSSGQQIERLDWLAQNLLELSKLDSGLVLLDLRPDDLRAAVEPAVEQSARRPRAGAASTLTLDLPDPPIQIRHDPLRIGQVVANLVGNAIKFTPRGGSVAVDVAADDRTAPRSTSPTPGVGIDAAELPRIFDRFFRGSRANEARGSGSGLGPRDRPVDRRHARRHASRSRAASARARGSASTLPRDPRLVEGTPPPPSRGRCRPRRRPRSGGDVDRAATWTETSPSDRPQVNPEPHR